jgi:hypothetical protein
LLQRSNPSIRLHADGSRNIRYHVSYAELGERQRFVMFSLKSQLAHHGGLLDPLRGAKNAHLLHAPTETEVAVDLALSSMMIETGDCFLIKGWMTRSGPCSDKEATSMGFLTSHPSRRTRKLCLPAKREPPGGRFQSTRDKPQSWRQQQKTHLPHYGEVSRRRMRM